MEGREGGREEDRTRLLDNQYRCSSRGSGDKGQTDVEISTICKPRSAGTRWIGLGSPRAARESGEVVTDVDNQTNVKGGRSDSR